MPGQRLEKKMSSAERMAPKAVMHAKRPAVFA